MIISRPKSSTLVSLIIFLILMYGIGIWSAITVPASPVYWVLIPTICLAIAFGITLKIVLSYQVLRIQGEQWRFKKLVGGSGSFSTRDIEWWKETEIKTSNSIFKELHIHTTKNRDLKISLHEHTNYQKVKNTVKTKHPKKEVKITN